MKNTRICEHKNLWNTRICEKHKNLWNARIYEKHKIYEKRSNYGNNGNLPAKSALEIYHPDSAGHPLCHRYQLRCELVCSGTVTCQAAVAADRWEHLLHESKAPAFTKAGAFGQKRVCLTHTFFLIPYEGCTGEFISIFNLGNIVAQNFLKFPLIRLRHS